jgi:hypothetical protein
LPIALIVHLLVGLSVTSMGLYSAGNFAVPFYMRVHGLTLLEAGSYLGTISTISSLIGMSLSGFGVDLIAKRGMRWYALVPCIGLVVTTPLYFYEIPRDPQLHRLLRSFGRRGRRPHLLRDGWRGPA